MVRSLFAGSLVMPGVLSELLANDGTSSVQSNGGAHFPARAKRVIFLYMTGGVSHIESFDHKPEFIRRGRLGTLPKDDLAPPTWDFAPGGQCGTQVNDIFPHLRECADDLCVIKSMTTDENDHFEATLGLHTGSYTIKRPSVGSWVSYGMGTENRDLPSFVVLAQKQAYGGASLWGSDFLPGSHGGTRIKPGDYPVRYLKRRLPADEQKTEFEFLQAFNRLHQKGREGNSALASRIQSFETAYGMQHKMPEILDIKGESEHALSLYGADREETKGFGWKCLVARRLAERGVRFIELIDDGNWDSHSRIKDHEKLARRVDRPIAGLLRDLKERGMLEDTLVVWTTEFGRTPKGTGKGRSHHRYAFSAWLAGGGVKGGMSYGETDDFGEEIVNNPVHIHDLHATMLHQLGFDHERLTFRHAGRDFRLTDVYGKVVKDILA
ncbi:MAG: DUF1501 domain-containing protein [Limisphaerales bacterium]